MSEKSVTVPAIHCGHCVKAIELELGDLAGVEQVEGDPQARTVRVRWSAPATWEAIRAVMAEIGYPPEE